MYSKTTHFITYDGKTKYYVPIEDLNVEHEEAVQRTQEMAALVGIGNLLDRKPAYQVDITKVAIARALVKKPRVTIGRTIIKLRCSFKTSNALKKLNVFKKRITTIFVTRPKAMSIGMV